MDNLEIFTKVEGGRIRQDQLQRILDYIEHVGDGVVFISVGKKRRSKSKEQRGYYWGVMIPLISDYTGYTNEETHEFLKEKFLTKRVSVDDDGVIMSTEALNTKETEQYYEDIRRFFSLQGVIIPVPNES